MLLAQLAEAGWTRWNAHLPIHALLLGRAAEPMLGLEDRIDMVERGWLSQLAGRDGRQAVLALAEGVGEQAAVAALPAEPLGFVPLDQGRARQPWLGNVVALGDAAAHFEPLGWFNLDLAHRQLDLLLELLPGREIDPRERAEFNRRAALMADRVRDLLGAHYAAPGAAQFGALERSGELALALDQHARRGRQPFFEESPLQVQEVSALFQALGHHPGESPLALAADPREAEAARVEFEAKALAALYATRPYGEWMQEVLGG